MASEKRVGTTATRFVGMSVSWGGRVLRVCLASGVVLVCLVVVLARVSIAAAADAGIKFSDELMKVGEHHVGGDSSEKVYTIELNGQTFLSSNTGTSRPVGVLLDYFQEQCRFHALGMRDGFQDLDTATSALPTFTGAEGMMVVRKDAGPDEGYVFCVAPDHSLSTGEIAERLAKFGRTGNLGEIGNLRYVAVRKGEAGTQVAAAWTDGALRLPEMFPLEGDAPGVDFGNVPRPNKARRTMSGTIHGSPFGINGYEVQGSVPETLDGIDGKLVHGGWRRLKNPDAMPDSERIYSLGAKLDVVVSVVDQTGGVSRATYAVSYNTGHVGTLQ